MIVMVKYNSNITRDNNGTYRVNYSYKSIFDGKRKYSCKRGFTTHKEACMWQRDELFNHIANKECCLLQKETAELQQKAKKLKTMYEDYRSRKVG